jgi:homoserine kinase
VLPAGFGAVSAETVFVRAPATSANLGPGFDCAAAAFELWNELEVDDAVADEPLVVLAGEGSDELPRDAAHLALRAFALVAPVEGHRFRFVNRIPLERGLGSSAATIAAGLVAGAAVSGRSFSVDELLELGLPLEGHADNLAAALRGGICLTWWNPTGPRAVRIATGLPLAAVVVVPSTRVSTGQARALLPETMTHHEAAAAAAQAALLGAAIASGDAELLADSFHDILHEPYRGAGAPLLSDLRDNPVTGAVGVTLSGSGPSVVVWLHKDRAAAGVVELERRLPDARILPLEIAQNGAEAK